MKRYGLVGSAFCASAFWLAGAFAAESSRSEIVSPQQPPVTFRLLREESSSYLTPRGKSLLERKETERARVIVARSARANTFDPASAKAGDRVIIDISPGESYVAILDRVAPAGPDYPEFIGWSGRLEIFGDSYVMLALTRTANGEVAIGGKIYFGGRLITFDPEGDETNTILIREIVSTALEGPPHRKESRVD